jgi:hypothetical protein
MNYKKVFRSLIAAVSFATLLSACTNDIDLNDVDNTLSVNGAAVFPLAQSTVTLNDFIDKLKLANITTNKDNILTVSYKPSINNNFDLNITPLSVSANINLGSSLSAVPAGMISKDMFNNIFGTSHPIPVQIDLSKISANVSQLDSIFINDASINLALKTNIDFTNSNIRLTIIPNPICFPGLPTYPFINVKNGSICHIPINRRHINTNNSILTLAVVLEATATNPITIPASPALDAHVSFDNINFQYIYGKFNYTLAPQTGTVDLGFLNDAISNTSYLPFKDPTIKIMRTSNAGLPIELNIDYIKSYNNAAPSNAKYAFGGVSTTQSFPTTPTQPGKTVTDSLVFNKANGNIDNLFTLPGINAIAYSLGAQISTTSNAKQYILNSNTFKIEPVINIPFAFNPNVNIQFFDTLSLGSSFTDFTDKNNLDNVKLWLTVNNYTSAKMTIELTLLDANYQFVSKQQINVDATLDVDATTGLATQTPTTKDQLCSLAFTTNDIKKTQYVKLSYALAGKDAQKSLTLKSSDFIKAKLSVYVKGNAKLN